MLAKKLTFQNVGKPEFKWSAPDGFPENVDYKGQLKQFDAAVSAGVKRIVVCSSMGGARSEVRALALCSLLITASLLGRYAGGQLLKLHR